MHTEVASVDQITTAVTHTLRAFPGAKITAEFVQIVVNELAKVGPSPQDLDRMKADVVTKFRFMPSTAEFLSLVEGLRSTAERMADRQLSQKIADDRRLFSECGLTQLDLAKMRKSGMTHEDIVAHCNGIHGALQIEYSNKNKKLSAETQASLDHFRAHVQALDDEENEEQNRKRRARLQATQCERGAAIMRSEHYKQAVKNMDKQEVMRQHEAREAEIAAKQGEGD